MAKAFNKRHISLTLRYAAWLRRLIDRTNPQSRRRRDGAFQRERVYSSVLSPLAYAALRRFADETVSFPVHGADSGGAFIKIFRKAACRKERRFVYALFWRGGKGGTGFWLRCFAAGVIMLSW